MSLAKKIHKSYRPATVEFTDIFRRAQRHPPSVPRTGRSHEYGNRLHREETHYPRVELLVVGGTSNGRSIL